MTGQCVQDIPARSTVQGWECVVLRRVLLARRRFGSSVHLWRSAIGSALLIFFIVKDHFLQLYTTAFILHPWPHALEALLLLDCG